MEEVLSGRRNNSGDDFIAVGSGRKRRGLVVGTEGKEKKLNITWTVACLGTWLLCFCCFSIQFPVAISKSATERKWGSHIEISRLIVRDCFFVVVVCFLLFTKQMGVTGTHAPRINPCRTIDWIIYTQGKREEQIRI
jgi:hypothetical protein